MKVRLKKKIYIYINIYSGKQAICSTDGHMRARNSTTLTAADNVSTAFIELQLEQDAEKQDIQ